MLPGLEELHLIVELAIWSGGVASERNAASLLLLAQPESAKSEIIQLYDGNKGVHLENDLTAWGLVRKVVPALLKNRARILLIPDLINPLMRSRDSAASFQATLAAFMEEGLRRISTKYISLELPHPIRGGVITSITPRELNTRRKWWQDTGFLSRFLLISYSHSDSLQALVHAILKRAQPGFPPIDLPLPSQPVAVRCDPKLLLPLDRSVARYFVEMEMEGSGYGYRADNNLRRLVMGAALRRGQESVAREDVELITHLVDKYGNLRQVGIAKSTVAEGGQSWT